MLKHAVLVARALQVLQRAQRMANRGGGNLLAGDEIADVALMIGEAYSGLRQDASASDSRALMAIESTLEAQSRKLDQIEERVQQHRSWSAALN
jgi:hypothetical protein